jgi:hypothetical protein
MIEENSSLGIQVFPLVHDQRGHPVGIIAIQAPRHFYELHSLPPRDYRYDFHIIFHAGCLSYS